MLSARGETVKPLHGKDPFGREDGLQPVAGSPVFQGQALGLLAAAAGDDAVAHAVARGELGGVGGFTVFRGVGVEVTLFVLLAAAAPARVVSPEDDFLWPLGAGEQVLEPARQGHGTLLQEFGTKACKLDRGTDYSSVDPTIIAGSGRPGEPLVGPPATSV